MLTSAKETTPQQQEEDTKTQPESPQQQQQQQQQQLRQRLAEKLQRLLQQRRQQRRQQRPRPRRSDVERLVQSRLLSDSTTIVDPKYQQSLDEQVRRILDKRREQEEEGDEIASEQQADASTEQSDKREESKQGVTREELEEMASAARKAGPATSLKLALDHAGLKRTWTLFRLGDNGTDNVLIGLTLSHDNDPVLERWADLLGWPRGFHVFFDGTPVGCDEDGQDGDGCPYRLSELRRPVGQEGGEEEPTMTYFGFLPKFKNGHSSSAPGAAVEMASYVKGSPGQVTITLKWSGLLGFLIAVRLSPTDDIRWIAATKNSLSGPHVPLVRDLMTEALINANDPEALLKELYDGRMTLCAECMHVHDQGHGYRLSRKLLLARPNGIAVFTLLGACSVPSSSCGAKPEGDDATTGSGTQQRSSSSRKPRNPFMQYKPETELLTFCHDHGLPTGPLFTLSAADYDEKLHPLLQMQCDVMTSSQLHAILRAYCKEDPGTIAHDDVVHGNRCEGLVIHSRACDWRIKFKMAPYTMYTFLGRVVIGRIRQQEAKRMAGGGAECESPSYRHGALDPMTLQEVEDFLTGWCLTDSGRRRIRNICKSFLYLLSVEPYEKDDAFEAREVGLHIVLFDRAIHQPHAEDYDIHVEQLYPSPPWRFSNCVMTTKAAFDVHLKEREGILLTPRQHAQATSGKRSSGSRRERDRWQQGEGNSCVALEGLQIPKSMQQLIKSQDMVHAPQGIVMDRAFLGRYAETHHLPSVQGRLKSVNGLAIGIQLVKDADWLLRQVVNLALRRDHPGNLNGGDELLHAINVAFYFVYVLGAQPVSTDGFDLVVDVQLGGKQVSSGHPDWSWRRQLTKDVEALRDAYQAGLAALMQRAPKGFKKAPEVLTTDVHQPLIDRILQQVNHPPRSESVNELRRKSADVAEELLGKIKAHLGRDDQPFAVMFLNAFPGSGKSTIARALEQLDPKVKHHEGDRQPSGQRRSDFWTKWSVDAHLQHEKPFKVTLLLDDATQEMLERSEEREQLIARHKKLSLPVEKLASARAREHGLATRLRQTLGAHSCIKVVHGKQIPSELADIMVDNQDRTQSSPSSYWGLHVLSACVPSIHALVEKTVAAKTSSAFADDVRTRMRPHLHVTVHHPNDRLHMDEEDATALLRRYKHYEGRAWAIRPTALVRSKRVLALRVTIAQTDGAEPFPTRRGFGHHVTLALLMDDATPMESNTLGTADHPIVQDIPLIGTDCFYGMLGARPTTRCSAKEKSA